jgi:hypothetical protein
MRKTKTKRKKKSAPRRWRLTARRRELIHDLAVHQGIAACRAWGLPRSYYPKAIAIAEEELTERILSMKGRG